jgi:iron complex outermembrane recepter protein
MNKDKTGQQSFDAWLRGGVSVLALGIVAATPNLAAAQPEITGISQNPTQAAAQDNDVATPAAAPDDDVVVTGRRAALEIADERKRRSETIIDSIVADDAGRLPDNSITEVLQRVPGVTIVRFAALNDPDHYSVEGSGIQVRARGWRALG